MEVRLYPRAGAEGGDPKGRETIRFALRKTTLMEKGSSDEGRPYSLTQMKPE